MFPIMPHHATLLRTALLTGALLALAFPRAEASTDVVELPDGTIVQVGDEGGVPVIRQWNDSVWTPVIVPVELLPAKGSFEGAGGDAQGNLYLSYSDQTNPKKPAGGLLARVGGAWSRPGAFDKKWEARAHVAALSPSDVFALVRNGDEKGFVLAHWNGSAYNALPLPVGTEEVNGLMVHDGALVLLAYGRGPSGNYGDGNSTYRLVGGTWERMGEPAKGSLEQLLHASDGTLWRLGRVAERWTGTEWEKTFAFNGSSLDGFRITRACAGRNGELYLVMADDDHKDHLACWMGSGDMHWLKGTEEASKFQYGLYDPFCDRAGVLHVALAGDPLLFTTADFEFSTDGYPIKDAMPSVVWLAYRASIPRYNYFSKELARLDSVAQATGAASDRQAYAAKADEAGTWAYSTKEQLKALMVPPKSNRLHDAMLEFFDKFQHYLYMEQKFAEALRTGQMKEEDRRTMEALTNQMSIAFYTIKDEEKVYKQRNGLK